MEAKRCLLEYYDSIDSYEHSGSPLEEILREDFLPMVVDESFENSLLVRCINNKTQEGLFLEKPKAKTIEAAMKRLGWKQRKGMWERME